MTVLIALCVPHDQREQAKAAGAVFDGAERTAYVDECADRPRFQVQKPLPDGTWTRVMPRHCAEWRNMKPCSG